MSRLHVAHFLFALALLVATSNAISVIARFVRGKFVSAVPVLAPVLVVSAYLVFPGSPPWWYFAIAISDPATLMLFGALLLFLRGGTNRER